MAEDSKSPRIPVVDFSALSIAQEDVPDANNPEVQKLVKELYSACSTFGSVYLTNHGIGQDEVDSILKTLAMFFALEPAVKEKYRKQFQKGSWCGWEGIESQKVTEKTPGSDLKESFDVAGRGYKDFEFPGGDLIPGFKTAFQAFNSRVKQLSSRVLTALAIGLDVNPEIFLSAHKDSSNTMLRFNNYPKLTKDIHVIPGQIRHGEHSDYGSVTLLFQDDAGGLEVATQDGTHIPVTPIPGTVLVSIADLMQRWTSDRLKPAVHRVIIPEEQPKKERCRQSIVYYVVPDDGTTVRCLDGSDKYPPTNASDYVLGLVKKTYSY